MQEKRRRNRNWSTVIGWLIFVLVIAGGPLLRFANTVLGGRVALPTNLLAWLIGGLVALSILVSVVRSIGSSMRGRGETRLPTSAAPPVPMSPFGGPAGPAQAPRTPTAPMPPFGGPAMPPQMPSLPATRAQPDMGTPRLPPATRFEPIINPVVLVLGLLGLLVLGGAALLILGPSLP